MAGPLPNEWVPAGGLFTAPTGTDKVFIDTDPNSMIRAINVEYADLWRCLHCQCWHILRRGAYPICSNTRCQARPERVMGRYRQSDDPELVLLTGIPLADSLLAAYGIGGWMAFLAAAEHVVIRLETR